MNGQASPILLAQHRSREERERAHSQGTTLRKNDLLCNFDH